jgi:diketogulonate reductase-like aldo/keto reductase
VSGGQAVATNQVLYNLACRGIEYDLLPEVRARRLPIMVNSPIEQARLLRHAGLGAVAREIGATLAQLALAWVIDGEGVIAILKAGRAEHVTENAAAAEIKLAPEIRVRLDALFPSPTGPTRLEML